MKKGNVINFNRFSFSSKYGEMLEENNSASGKVIEIINRRKEDHFRVMLDEKYVAGAYFISRALSRIVYVSEFDLIL